MKYSFFIVLILLGLVGFVVSIQQYRGPSEITLSSGKLGGGYQRFSNSLADLIESKKTNFSLRVQESEGSVENIRRLEKGQADLALVQLGCDPSADLRSLATVYSDVVHILKKQSSDDQFLIELKEKKISVGLPNSGTRKVADELLSHYGIEADPAKHLEWGPSESLEALLAGEIDAMILVTELRAPVNLDAGKVSELTQAIFQDRDHIEIAMPTVREMKELPSDETFVIFQGLLEQTMVALDREKARRLSP